jgi:hypothetical protein
METTTSGGAELTPLPGWQLAMSVGLVAGLALVLLAAAIWFYHAIGRGSFMEDLTRDWLLDRKPEAQSVTALIDEFVTRRYEFLTFIGQFVIAALVTAVIGILLLTQSVRPDAGLPLLATILGIVLGKGVLTRRALPEQSPQAGQPQQNSNSQEATNGEGTGGGEETLEIVHDDGTTGGGDAAAEETADAAPEPSPAGDENGPPQD